MTFQTAIQSSPLLQIRLACISEKEVLEDLKERSIAAFLDPLLSSDQKRAMRQITPFDPALIVDGTYYVATVDGQVAASGGWSRRAALHSDSSRGSLDAGFLNPDRDAAVIRAMYTHPAFARCGLGSLVLSTALAGARLAGFRHAQLLATTIGERLYRANGWKIKERKQMGAAGDPKIPAFIMARDL